MSIKKRITFELNGVPGVCKCPAAFMWVEGEAQNYVYPVIYFRKPEGISDKDFKESIELIVKQALKK